MQELERGDSTVRSAETLYRVLWLCFLFSEFGSEEQKRKISLKLASGEFIGAFGFNRALITSSNPEEWERITKI